MIISGSRTIQARAAEANTPSDRSTFAGGVDEGRFSSVEQAIALPVAYGRFRISGSFLSPLWRLQSEKEDGKAGDAGLKRYYARVAYAFCHGPLTELTDIIVADEKIWSGPLTRSAGNEAGVTLSTQMGQAQWYWGTETQLADPWFQDLNANQPGLRGTAYLVFRRCRLGPSPTGPSVSITAKRTLSLLSLSTHSLSNDAVLPEVLYDLLTHPRYGAKVPAERIHTASFQAAAETIIDEDLGASPVIDSTTALRETTAKLLTYMGAVRYFDGGKIVLKLIRNDAGETPLDIGPDDLLEEPEPTPGGWDSTWNVTRVAFTNAANDWAPDVYGHRNPANARVRGYIVPQDVGREWFTRSDVVKREAARLSGLNGMPIATYSGLQLRPSFRNVRPGQLLRLTYPKLNITAAYLRAEKVTVGGPDEPGVTIDAVQDPSRQTTLGYVPAGSELGLPGVVRDPLVQATVRIATLTADLKEGSADGLLVAMSRPTGMTIRHETHFTWDPAYASYGRLAYGASFPIFGTILWWMRQGTSWIVRFRIAAEFDQALMATIAESFLEHYLVAGRRVVRTSPASDTHALLCVLARRKLGGRFAAIAADTFDVEVEAAMRGTVDLALETTGAGASAPTGAAFFGRLDNFTILRSDTLAFDRAQANDPADSSRRRYIKVLVGDDQSILELGDVAAVEFRRNDTTMDAAGSYSPTWGARAKTAYEMADDEWGLQYEATPSADYAQVTDLDDALGLVYEGTATADDTALLASLDDVLGAYIEIPIYNDTP